MIDPVLALILFGDDPGGGVTPTGNINITDTAVTDVAAYATAQVVDNNLVAANIKKDVDILGVTGSYEGSGGGGAQPQRDVNFIDYDGTILHSYTAAEFATLTAMPDNPDHSSDIQWGGHTIPLTSQGWNYTLAKAQAYVAAYGKLWIGQMYKTTDGKLHLCVRMGEGRLNPASRFTFTGTATIDWGDGTTPVTASLTLDNEHTYSATGDYDVAISVSEGGTIGIVGLSTSTEGCYLLQTPKTTAGENEHVYQNCIVSAFLSDSVTAIGSFAFQFCYGLQSVTIPDGITNIGKYAFNYCASLRNVTIPDSVTSIGDNALEYCYSLQSVTIPDSVTSIGTQAFNYCTSLQGITIPDSVTSIGDYAFRYCYSLRSIIIPNSVTSIGNYAFQFCYGLQSVTISDSITSIGKYVFRNCQSLRNVTIPDGVTSIGDYAFNTCYSLQGITIPDSVTSIGIQAFNTCCGLGYIRFESATPPTVTNSNAWTKVPTDCKIYVPVASLTTYKSTTNYPNPSTYTYVGY